MAASKKVKDAISRYIGAARSVGSPNRAAEAAKAVAKAAKAKRAKAKRAKK